MGVRINSSASAAKASAQQAASKKDGQPAAGTDTDFSEVLAKVQPKKKADACPAPSDKPAPAAAKVAGKKQAKAKSKDEQADESRPATPLKPAAKQTKVNGDDDDATRVGGADSDTTPVAAVDDGDDSDGDTPTDDGTAISNPAPVVQTDPTQMVAQATAVPTPTPAPTSTPVQATTTVSAQQSQQSVATDVRPAKTVKTAPVENLSAAAKAPAAAPAKDRKPAGVVAEDDVQDVKPTAAPDEVKVAVHPAGQGQDDQAPADGEQGSAEVHAQAKSDASQVATAASPVAQFNELFQTAVDRISGDETEKPTDKATSPIDAALTAATNNTPAPKAAEAKPAQPPAPPVAPDVRFAEDNHPKVVTAVKSQLLPGGGSIQLRLDPPDLGPLRLEVRMEDGSMSASFVTASDQATSLLTHTLGQLKHALEGAGISVDKLQVRQGSAEQFADGSDQRQQQGAPGDQSSARQEQQRREMLNRMWQKVAGGDPLDLVA